MAEGQASKPVKRNEGHIPISMDQTGRVGSTTRLVVSGIDSQQQNMSTMEFAALRNDEHITVIHPKPPDPDAQSSHPSNSKDASGIDDEMVVETPISRQ
ncbi:hypothetical protein A2U01_0042577 [Trifolium medium]|uniref:Uncharacterized protein n=1 Tax=Trifolium medium TaxID=97028 RepID=A0A392QBZ3_9FABA|nr:hypothetical protein [Trifolium medium]